jgi:hypothetical protein
LIVSILDYVNLFLDAACVKVHILAQALRLLDRFPSRWDGGSEVDLSDQCAEMLRDLGLVIILKQGDEQFVNGWSRVKLVS